MTCVFMKQTGLHSRQACLAWCSSLATGCGSWPCLLWAKQSPTRWAKQGRPQGLAPPPHSHIGAGRLRLLNNGAQLLQGELRVGQPAHVLK